MGVLYHGSSSREVDGGMGCWQWVLEVEGWGVVGVWTYRAESLEIFLFWMKVWREGIAIT